MLTILLLIVLFACVAMLWNEGLWGNAMTLVNVTLAGLIATNYFEPAAAFLDEQMPSYTYFWDFLSLWGIFVVTFGIMRLVTDLVSKTKVKFKAPVEHAGRVIFAFVVGYVMICLIMFSLHMAPLPEHAFGGSFHQVRPGLIPGTQAFPSYFLGMAPDRQWLAFVQTRSGSGGALSRWWGVRQFDPEGRFIFKYGARRRRLEIHNKQTGEMRVRMDVPPSAQQ